MEEIKTITILGWAIAVIGSLIFFLVGMVGFFISELWRIIRDTRTKLDKLSGEHSVNHRESK